jgi:hypothetical protein
MLKSKKVEIENRFEGGFKILEESTRDILIYSGIAPFG